ncbi:MAG: helix-turn-helix domain-containing protein [Clostridiales bacterium]|nr:helix-turn-helix domain-containing protein [Clostridiales bacterium]
MDLNNLGANIKKIRQAKGMTQEQLAERADISVNFMSLIENGKNMSAETLVKIANSLEVSVDNLMCGATKPSGNKISEQIMQSLYSLDDNEKLFFLDMIKQYKNLK